MIHHIAIGTNKVSPLSIFYAKLPQAKKIQDNLDEKTGRLRSVWIGFGDQILMIEEGEQKAPRALVFKLEKNQSELWNIFIKNIKIIKKTEFSIYFEDPDGNQLGLSSYPEKFLLET